MRIDGAGDRKLGRLGRQHHGGHRLARRQGRLYRQGARRPARARCSATTSPRSACGSTRRARDSGPGTARCLIMVTPDGQRTMAPISAPASSSARRTSTPALVGAAQVTYLEGYLLDPPRAQEAFRKAAALAHAAGRQVALSLSDPFCVGRHRAEFRDLVARRGRHPVRQRGRDLLAVRDRRLRRGGRGGARPCRDRRADPQREGQRRARRRRGARRRRRRRSRTWSTRPAPATFMPQASSTA